MKFRAVVELGGKTATGARVVAKKADTRATRLAKTVECLRAGQRTR
jgi:hypothetical protein